VRTRYFLACLAALAWRVRERAISRAQNSSIGERSSRTTSRTTLSELSRAGLNDLGMLLTKKGAFSEAEDSLRQGRGCIAKSWVTQIQYSHLSDESGLALLSKGDYPRRKRNIEKLLSSCRPFFLASISMQLAPRQGSD